MLVKTLLIFLIGFLGYSEWLLGTSYFQRPIVLGPLVGLVMGDVVTGVIMGATMELAMVGAISVGAYNPPDTISGTILGVSLAMQAGADPLGGAYARHPDRYDRPGARYGSRSAHHAAPDSPHR